MSYTHRVYVHSVYKDRENFRQKGNKTNGILSFPEKSRIFAEKSEKESKEIRDEGVIFSLLPFLKE